MKLTLAGTLSLLLSGAMILAVAAKEQKPIGIVYALKGSWTITCDGVTKPLHPYDGVGDGAVLSPGSSSDLVIVELIDRSEVIQRGNGPKAPIALKSADVMPELVRAFDLFRENPKNYVAVISRGSGPQLIDDLTTLQQNEVDLSKVFSKQPDGEYRFVLQKVTGAAIPEPAIGPFTFSFQHAQPVKVKLADVKPDLYCLTVMHGKEKTALKAWVLLQKPDNYAKLADRWQAALAKTANWDHDEHEGMCSAGCYRKAYLHSLSETSRAGAN
jgi:hypothetical protein